jgi:hypothetical protein
MFQVPRRGAHGQRAVPATKHRDYAARSHEDFGPHRPHRVAARILFGEVSTEASQEADHDWGRHPQGGGPNGG